MVKCIICERRPARGQGYCANCNDHLESERKKKNGKPRFYITYKGHVVGLYPNGEGRLTPRLLNCNPTTLPKSKTINLNRYCDGFTREKIKSFKACVLQLANA